MLIVHGKGSQLSVSHGNCGIAVNWAHAGQISKLAKTLRTSEQGQTKPEGNQAARH